MVLATVDSDSDNLNTLVNTDGNKSKKVFISFKYLDKCNIQCFQWLSKYDRKNKEQKVFRELQHFLYEAEECKNTEDLITQFTSPHGSTIKMSNEFVKRIIFKFKKEYPMDKGLLSDRLIHIHSKRNGNGEFVIFGACYENTFYVLAFDPEHKFDK